MGRSACKTGYLNSSGNFLYYLIWIMQNNLHVLFLPSAGAKLIKFIALLVLCLISVAGAQKKKKSETVKFVKLNKKPQLRDDSRDLYIVFISAEMNSGNFL